MTGAHIALLVVSVVVLLGAWIGFAAARAAGRSNRRRGDDR